MPFAWNAFCTPPRMTTLTTANPDNDTNFSMQYYIVKNGEPTGPYSLEQLQALVTQGSASPAELCWAEGLPTWVPLGQVLGILLPESGFAVARGYAGFWRRVGALLIDLLILMVPSHFLSRFGPPLPAFEKAQSWQEIGRMWTEYSHQTAHLQLLALLLTWLYFAFMESSSRQGTLGKNAMRLIVTDARGSRISFVHATGRFLVKNFLSFGLTMGMGCLMSAFTLRKQALHDLVAGTLVLRK